MYATSVSVFEDYVKALSEGRKVYMIVLVVKTDTNDYWTDGGHYLAITNARIAKNGKTEYYVRDSGPKENSGWYESSKLLDATNVYYLFENVSE